MAQPLGTLLRQHLAALRMLLIFTAVTGIAFPLAVTAIAQITFPHRAGGSLVEENGQAVASSLIGQNFDITVNGKDTGRPDPRWFQPRPSAGSYNPLASGASNLGSNNPNLVTQVQRRRAAISTFDHVPPTAVPADALTASGSGLDPDISPAYAYEQADRVAHARGLPPTTVRSLVTAHLQHRALGFLGQEHVDVVQLNHALTRLR